jgi:3-phytase
MKICTFTALTSLLIFSFSCTYNGRDNNSRTISGSYDVAGDMEAIEDSMELVIALSAQALIQNRVTASVETEPVGSAQDEDAADDPAIWYNRKNPSGSLVLGTDKNAGIYVYDLEGRVVQFRMVGRINNVDLREEFSYLGREVVLVAGSNRSNNSISLLVLDTETGQLSDTLANVSSGVDEVYGVCCYRHGNEFHVFVNGKGGRLEQWRITGYQGIRAEKLRTLNLSSQPEGMVADDRNGILYVGVEQEGIYRLDANPEGDRTPRLISGSSAENDNISYDIEGLALFSHEGTDYLIASSQGNFSYAIFDLKQGNYLTSFVISEGAVDGAEETDGLDIHTGMFNESFPGGILVVQDGFNTDGTVPRSQNFKFVSFSQIEPLLKNR